MSCTKAANLPVTSSFDIYTAFSSGICCLTPNRWCDLHAGVWLNIQSNIHATGIHNTPTHNKQLTDTLNWHTKHSDWQITPSPTHKTHLTNTHSHTKKNTLDWYTHTLSATHKSHLHTLTNTYTIIWHTHLLTYKTVIHSPIHTHTHTQGARCSSVVRVFAHGAMDRQINSWWWTYWAISRWCNKGCGMCYPVCGMVHIKEPLLLIRKSSPCSSRRFPLSLSEWSFTMFDTI